MQLERVLDRCHGLEARAAAVYRTFAAAARGDPVVCALWTDLAREEEQHARSIDAARSRLRRAGGTPTSIDGWEEALGVIEDRLLVAERLGASGATTAQQFAAALDVEMTEIEALRQVALAAADVPELEEQSGHAERLAEAAEALTDDPQVRLQAALLRARTRVQRA
jgi:rubrerythrin